jgi:mannose-6-phosphate isomerase
MTVTSLPANQPETFYRGGGRIASFRGTSLPDLPEDWVGSTTSRFGNAPAGMTVLPDGQLLADAVAADPAWWLGPDRPADPGILVKLLDAGQRLPLHVHPDRRFATSHLASPYGKTEAWVIVSAEPDAVVHLGFSRDVSPGLLAEWVAGQKTGDMLAATNVVPVRPGDAVLCPAGLPHAIGAGILLVEVQEPTDFSVLLEWEGFDVDGPGTGHLGLGYELALQCVDRGAWDPDRLAALGRSRPAAGGVQPLFAAAAEEFFAGERLRPDPSVTVPASFAVVVVTAGTGVLTTAAEAPVTVRGGDTLLVPYAAGPLTLTGAVEAVRCRPPARALPPP